MHQGKKEESVEELLQKLAKKGKKVKLLEENSASVKELPRHQEEDDEEGLDINERQDLEVEAQESVSPNKSSVKKKMTKIKEDREEQAALLLEQQQ